MGNITEIIELQGQVERKDAYIDKLEGQLDVVTADRDQRAELSARLFSENQTLRAQLNQKQLETDHCRACCDELRAKLSTAVADALEAEAALILAAPDDAAANGDKAWSVEQITIAAKIAAMMKGRAALARAKAGV